MKKEYSGCWPTMITPFTADNHIDYQAVRKMVDWYIGKGCDGIFAVCQSSEMFFLDTQEKLDLARAVIDAADGRVKVIASGHTADDLACQIDGLGKMAETGVDAVVLVSNRIARKDEGEETFRRNADYIFTQLPEVVFGLYECPYPYLRLLSTGFLSDCAKNGKLVFLKDVSCSNVVLEERIKAIQGTGLALFNANTSTLLDSLIAGADGYNGVMANFHIDIYKWMFNHFRQEPERARMVSDFLTVAAVTEARAYPMNAKYHMNATGIPMGIATRSKDIGMLNENAIHEIESLIRMENAMRGKLGI
jgi:4-hydroxy-tetrahydrodipicolinate synthase